MAAKRSLRSLDDVVQQRSFRICVTESCGTDTRLCQPQPRILFRSSAEPRIDRFSIGIAQFLFIIQDCVAQTLLSVPARANGTLQVYYIILHRTGFAFAAMKFAFIQNRVHRHSCLCLSILQKKTAQARVPVPHNSSSTWNSESPVSFFYRHAIERLDQAATQLGSACSPLVNQS